MISIECVWPARTILGEAPFWCSQEKVVYWVDIDGKAILRFNPATGEQQVFPQQYEVGCVVKKTGGGFIAAANKDLLYFDQDLKNPEVFSTPEPDDLNNRFNDGKCDRAGRFWVGSTDINEEEPSGALYRVSRGGDVKCMLPDLTVANGLGWSPDDKTMYFTDSGHGTIYAFDFSIETGAIDNQRVFAQVDAANGVPDGLTVDAEGYVWSAHWNGWQITRYDPEGQIDRVIRMPVPLVTSIAFGGEHLDQMYVTTASYGLSEAELDEAPRSGGLFVISTGVRGLPEVPFAGA